MTPELPLHIDSTMLVTWKSCQRKFFLQFCHGLRPASGSIHLVAGGAIAAGLDAARRLAFSHHSAPHKMLLEAAMPAFAKEWGDFPEMRDHNKSFVNSFCALDEYLKKYPPHTDPVQPYIKQDGTPAVEFSFAIPLPILHPSGSPFLFCGRFDLLGLFNGLPCILDEKTTTSFGPSWTEKWAMRSQFLGYCWACKQLGIDVELAIVRGICLLKREYKFLQVPQQYPTWQIDRWYQELLWSLEDIVDAYSKQRFRLDFGDACEAYGGCAYQPLCITQRPDDWMSTYHVHHWNPVKFNPAKESTDEKPKEKALV